MSVRRSVAIAALIAAGAIAGSAGSAAAQQLEPPFRVQAAGKPINVDTGHAGPYFADFDGDGLRDLIVGQHGRGRCRVYKNTGTKQAPVFGEFTWFEADGKPATVMTG